jgi:hypothetical protein
MDLGLLGRAADLRGLGAIAGLLRTAAGGRVNRLCRPHARARRRPSRTCRRCGVERGRRFLFHEFRIRLEPRLVTAKPRYGAVADTMAQTSTRQGAAMSGSLLKGSGQADSSITQRGSPHLSTVQRLIGITRNG